MHSIMKIFTLTILILPFREDVLTNNQGLENSGICYYNGHWTKWTKGYNQVPFACQIMRCNEDGSILVKGCRMLELPKCTLLGVGNYFKPYPDCCEMNYQCIDDEGNLYTKQWNQLKNMNEQVRNEEDTSSGDRK